VDENASTLSVSNASTLIIGDMFAIAAQLFRPGQYVGFSLHILPLFLSFSFLFPFYSLPFSPLMLTPPYLFAWLAFFPFHAP